MTADQQRERERQRLKEDDDERRKKLVTRKDQPATQKFEPLAVDMNNDDARGHKSKTPIAGTGAFSPNFPSNNGATTKVSNNKPTSITPSTRVNHHDENNPITADTNAAGASAVNIPKKTVLKKRSSVLV